VEVIDLLIDLDPDALGFPDDDDSGRMVPLHHALWWHPTSPTTARMVRLRPDTLLRRDFRGLTPVECALRLGPPETPHLASVLRTLVQLRPGSVVFLPSLDPWSTVDEETALHWACRRFRAFPALIEEIAEAFPPALLFAASETRGLPFEVVAEAADDPELVATLKQNTLHMALAVVGYVLGGGVVLAEDEDTASFQSHTTETVAAFLPEPDLAGGSGFEAALAVGKLRNIVDLVREVFHDERFRDLLHKNTEFRNVVTGEAVVDCTASTGWADWTTTTATPRRWRWRRGARSAFWRRCRTAAPRSRRTCIFGRWRDTS
jgi:hypothetical protein